MNVWVQSARWHFGGQVGGAFTAGGGGGISLVPWPKGMGTRLGRESTRDTPILEREGVHVWVWVHVGVHACVNKLP